jgi:hypothetical protein
MSRGSGQYCHFRRCGAVQTTRRMIANPTELDNIFFSSRTASKRPTRWDIVVISTVRILGL